MFGIHIVDNRSNWYVDFPKVSYVNSLRPHKIIYYGHRKRIRTLLKSDNGDVQITLVLWLMSSMSSCMSLSVLWMSVSGITKNSYGWVSKHLRVISSFNLISLSLSTTFALFR